MASANCYRDLADDSEDHGSDKPADVENVLEAVGVPGRYQIFQIVCLSFCWPVYAVSMLNFVFIGYEAPHVCHELDETLFVGQTKAMINDSKTSAIGYGSCNVTWTFFNESSREIISDIHSKSCVNGYDYKGGKHASMVTEWDLVCERDKVPAIAQTMLVLGNGVGVMILSPLSDHFGRKYIYMVTLVAGTLSELGIVFAANIFLVIALRFVTGFMYGVMALNRGVITTELLVSRHRQTFGSLTSVIWSVGLLFLAGLAFIFRRQWRYLQLTTSLISVIPIVLSFWVEESFAWYIAKGRYEDAERIVLKACKTNSSDVTNVRDVFRQCVHLKSHQRKAESSKCQGNPILDIVRTRELFTVQAILCFLCFTAGLCYYGMFMISATLFGDRFVNFALLALLEIPGSFTYMTLLFYWGRRTVLFLGVALVAGSLFVPIFLSIWTSGLTHSGVISTAFVLFSHLVTAVAFNLLYTYSPELFPTTLRTTALSLCVISRRISGMIAPLFIPLTNKIPWAVFAILECLCLVSLCLIPLLPETRGKQLPTTVSDVLAWEKVPKRDEDSE